MPKWVDPDELAERERTDKAKKTGVRNAAGYRVDCPYCGKNWHPSMDESETFPGSACDIGECTEGWD